MKKFIVGIAIAALWFVNAEAVTGQIRNLLPKIIAPKNEAPVTRVSDKPASESVPAAAARQDVVDDGYTWFEAENVEGLDANHRPITLGWFLHSYVRVFGEYPNRSAIKLVVSKAGKPVATTRCEASRYSNTTRALDESFMVTQDCWRKDTATKELGVFDLLVYTVNGQTDEEKLVRTYKIDVRTINRVPGGQQPGIAPPKYLIQRHNEAPVSWMFLRPREYVGYLAKGSSPERRGANHVEFHYSLSPDEMGKALPYTAYMRCSVNGKRLAMPGPEGYADQATSHIEHEFSLIHQDRVAPKFHRGTEYQDEIGFRILRLAAPLTWGEKQNRDNRIALEDNPGQWQCDLMHNGEVWRTWRFTIGADGRPPLHSEQKGNINLGFNSYLVDMEIPAGGTALDKRLAGPSTGLFYGIPWASPEGKAMAAKVPKKGNPFPVNSDSPNRAKQSWEN